MKTIELKFVLDMTLLSCSVDVEVSNGWWRFNENNVEEQKNPKNLQVATGNMGSQSQTETGIQNKTPAWLKMETQRV